MTRLLVFWLTLLCLPMAQAQFAASSSLWPSQLALVVNDDEPNSVAIGEYYRSARGIPAENVVHVRIPNRPRRLDAARFKQLREQINDQLRPNVEAVLMVWSAPYAVECNSITAAFTMGLDLSVCDKPCGPSQPSAYFNAPAGRKPYAQYGMRLSMLLPTESVEQARALIDRGKASDASMPTASAYYLSTSQTARNSRSPYFPPAGTVPARKLAIKRLAADVLEDRQDIMVYQTGMAKVDKLDTLRFLPGALADHLTSFGGDLLGSSQMSSLRWLEAGATASYGSVTEPCNYWQKFPQPTVLLRHYLEGASAIEAYWRSVAWPAQGVFIGEPLAAPYRR